MRTATMAPTPLSCGDEERVISMSNIDHIHIRNWEALSRLPGVEIEKHRGEFAIFVDGEAKGYYPTNKAAVRAAYDRFRNVEFSVLRVDVQPVELGSFHCGDDPRQTS